MKVLMVTSWFLIKPSFILRADGEFIEIPEMLTDITFSRSLSQVNEYADDGSNVISMEAAETTMEEEERAAENFRAQLKELKEVIL